MYFCKVKPSEDDCRVCRIQAFHSESEVTCEKCKYDSYNYELMSVGYNRSVGNWAMVLRNGQIERVELDRVYDVRTNKYA